MGSSGIGDRAKAKMGSGHVTGLRCLRCGHSYPPTTSRYVCDCRPNVGSDLGTLQVEYDYTAILGSWSLQDLAADNIQSIGRYGPLLPLAHLASLPPVPVGMTPLLQTPNAVTRWGLEKLYIKDDGRNPSASLKDRASAIALARASEHGASVVATASTGNAAAALATLAAGARMKTVIFVPRTAPTAKMAQLLIFGSTVLAVDGTYDDAFDLCVEACQHFGWYNRNTGYNPWMTEGKKTVAYEIAEQYTLARNLANQSSNGLNRLDVPDVVFVSVGDGCIIGGIHKGFADLLALGWIDRIPRLYGVQSSRSAALFRAWKDDRVIPELIHATTRADSISVDAPRDAMKALAAVRQTGGAFIQVPDGEILAAVPEVAQQCGVFAEPAGAAAFAGLAPAIQQGYVDRANSVVVVNTGSGLKDVAAALEISPKPQVIEPTLSAVRKALA